MQLNSTYIVLEIIRSSFTTLISLVRQIQVKDFSQTVILTNRGSWTLAIGSTKAFPENGYLRLRKS